MADIKFTCPHCSQDIQCDQLWCGHQIDCPTCKGAMTVPQMEALAAPSAPTGTRGSSRVFQPPAAGTRLSAGRTQVARSTDATGVPQKAFQPTVRKGPSPLITYALIALGVGGVGAGAYFYGPQAYHAVEGWFGAKTEAASKRPIVGEVGAAMDANDALEGNTDANRTKSPLAKNINSRIRPRSRTPGVPVAGDGAAAAADNAGADNKALPIVPPGYTLDVAAAKIPESRVNGLISGTNFLSDAARVIKVASIYTLSLSQGVGLSPDRGAVVFLHLRPTEFPTNQSFTVAADAKDPVVSTVQKFWKNDPRFAPSRQSFSTGFVLKLELGTMTDGLIPGKIFLALPDTDKTVVAGLFKAALVVPDPNALPPPVAVAPVARPATNSAARTAMQQRYGRKR